MFRCALAALATVALVAPAVAQVQRVFPQNALRGSLVIGQAPEVKLNGLDARLAPAVRIRDQNNMLQISGALSGLKLLVHYTVDTSGMVKDVWILRPEEAALRWPTTPEQAQTWVFDTDTHTWAQP